MFTQGGELMFGSYRNFVDLTMPITSNMSVPPAVRKALPSVTIKKLKDAKQDGYQVSFFETGIHAGTHLDAPIHMVPSGATIDKLPLNHFFGEGYCIDCTEVGPNGSVTAEVLSKADGKIKPGMIVFLCTGWSDKMFGTDEYWFDSPVLDPSGAQWLVNQKAKIAGFDFFQEAAAKANTINPEKYLVHKILLSNGCLNIEHLVNLQFVVNREFYAFALPLYLSDTEGSPTRVIAFLR